MTVMPYHTALIVGAGAGINASAARALAGAELDPDGIAQTCLEVLREPRNAWSLEVELRPWVETF